MEATESARVVLVVSPFKMDRSIFYVTPGSTISEVLRAAQQPTDLPARIFVNDNIVLDGDRNFTRVAAGDLVTIRAIPKAPAIAALLVAAGVSASTVAVGTTGFAIISAVTSSALGLIGTLVMKALVPPPKPPERVNYTVPASYSISGSSNQLTPYAPVPRQFGRRRVSPIIAAQSYTEVVGPDQYLRMVLTNGYGPLEQRRLKIAQTLLENFQGVEWELRAGYPDDAPLSLYSNDVTEQSLQVLLLDTGNRGTVPKDWQKQTTGINADEISVDLSWPGGLNNIGANGVPYFATVIWQVKYGVVGQPASTFVGPGGAQSGAALDITKVSQSRSIVRATVNWRVPRGQYDVWVRVKSLTVQGGFLATSTWYATTYWTALRTVRHTNPITMKGVSKIALRIRASNQLSGQVSQLSTIAASIVRDYDPKTQSWEGHAGSWDYDWWGGPGGYTLDSVRVYKAGGKSLKVVGGGVLVASASIPVKGWQQHQLQVTGVVSGSGTVIVQGVFGIDDNTQFTWGNWTAHKYNNIGDRITPLVNNPGPFTPPHGGYTFICVKAGRSGAVAPGWLENPGEFTQDGDAVWENYGGPPVHIVTIFSGSVGAGWTPINGLVTVPYPSPVAYESTATYEMGDVVIYNGSVFVALRQAPPGQIANTAIWAHLAASIIRDCNFFRLVLQSSGTVYWDEFAVKHSKSGINVLPNGSFDYPGRVSQNPASHYREVLQGSANKRAVADSRVDIPMLQTWHQYAAANGYWHNGTYDKPSTVFETLRSIAAVGRAGFFQKDDLYSVVLDVPQGAPIQHFTPRNSWGFKSTKAFPDLPQAVRVRFCNMARDYQIDELTVYDDGFSAATPNLRVELLDESFGVAAPVLNFAAPAPNGSQPWRDGRYHMAQGRLRPEIYQLETDIESLVCTRGDLVYVVHDVTQWGLGQGRIVGVTYDGAGRATSIMTDEALFGVAGRTCAIRVRTKRGTSLLAYVGEISSTIGVQQLTPTVPMGTGVDHPEVGDLFLFGIRGSESAQLIVTAIEPKQDLTATIYLQDYVPAIYSAEAIQAPGFTSAIAGLVTKVAAPKIVAVRSNISVMVPDAQRTPN